MSSKRDAYVASARRGAQWVVDRQRTDGSFFDADLGVGGYYKIPFMLGLSGYVPEGVRLMTWARRHHFTAEGDFRAPSRKATLAIFDDWPTYANAWLVQGAHQLRQFDLSSEGAKFLLRFRAPCGGFHAYDDGQPYVECVGTSWSGLTQLIVGNLEAATAAAACLQRLADQQPRPDRFYFRMTTDGELITDVPEDAALGHYVDSKRRAQIYFHPGIALIFLCHYHQATTDAAALKAAQTIFAFTQRCQDDVYAFPPSGKLGLGCALLWTITGESEPRDAACTVSDYLVRTQCDDGHWRLPDEDLYSMIEDKNDPEVITDITAEFTTFLWQIAALI